MRSGIIPADAMIRSAVLIQKWFRRHRARLERRRRVAWKVYQSIEYSGETSQNLLQRFFKDILSNYHTVEQEMSKTSGKSAMSTETIFYERLRQYCETDHSEEEIPRNFDSIQIELGYEGAHLKFPMSAITVQEMIEKFKVGKQLHPKYLLHLLRHTKTLLQSRPNIQKFSTSISKKVTVVGDLHGHLDDLLIIFDKNGLPDVTNPYVFNGDYVDRGPNSVEVIAVLFACQVTWPTAVFLNRGNHEDPIMNISHGFEEEIRGKYRRHMSYLLELFCQVFSWLPLATIIDDLIFVTHGGISDTLDLKVVEKLDRHQVESVSSIRRLLLSDEKNISKIEREQVEHLLWNDPENTPGCSTAENRSFGVCFGPDVTADFLNRHKFIMLVRSHECFPGGYNYKHNRKTLTIFSASNYFNPNSNLGAYVKFDNNGVADIIQFRSSRTVRESLSCRTTSLEDDAIRALRSKIVASKSELTEAFQQLDQKETGSVTISDWCDAMKKTLKMDLPWRILRPHLVKKNDPHETVKYMTTFDKIGIQHCLDAVDATVAETIYKNRVFLEEIFRIIDTDKNGFISPQEFKECCLILGQVTQRQMPAEEVAKMAKTLDLNSDGKIDFNEFLESFRIVNS